MGIAILSPKVDSSGISTRGEEFSKLLVEKYPILKSL